MSTANPGDDPALETVAARPLTITVDLAALAHNAHLASAGVAHPVADLRADASGLGLTAIGAALLAAGISAARVDDEPAALALLEHGYRTADAATPATLDPRTLFGLPGGAHGSRPLVRLTGTLLSTKLLRAGEGVSYGYTHRAVHDSRVALVTGGYAQGLMRSLGNNTTVTIDGRRCPIVGRVAMDVCVVDVGDIRPAPGTEVLFLGVHDGEPVLADWCATTGLGAREIVTAIGLRARREYTS